jgi:ribonuclease-3
VQQLLEKLGIKVNPDLLVLALTHRSFANENGELPTNERLEFLGDTILSYVVTTRLYQEQEKNENELTKIRAKLVSKDVLAKIADSISLGKYVLLGKGEESTGGRSKASILCDTLEAVIGAVYLSLGIEGASIFIHKLLDEELFSLINAGPSLDWKISLANLAKEKGLNNPEYEFEERGLPHNKIFSAKTFVDGREYIGEGTSKKHAQYMAAQKAYNCIKTTYKS